MTPQRIAMLLLGAFALAGCDPLALGYANKLSYPITVVENGHKLTPGPIHLAPGESRAPGFSLTAESIDLLDRRGHIRAPRAVRIRQRARPRQAEGFELLGRALDLAGELVENSVEAWCQALTESRSISSRRSCRRTRAPRPAVATACWPSRIRPTGVCPSPSSGTPR